MNSSLKLIYCLILAAALFAFAFPVFAISLDNPIKNPAAAGAGSTVVDVIVGGFYGFVTLIAIFAFGFLVISGFKMILARDNPDAITSGKQAVMWSVLGLGAAILSITIILSVQTLIGGSNADVLKNPNALQIPLTVGSNIPSLGALGIANSGFLGVFIQIVVNIAGLAFVVCALMVIWAGYQMVFSGGNEEKITASRTILLWALVGMGVIILSYLIVAGVNRVLVNLPNAGSFTP